MLTVETIQDIEEKGDRTVEVREAHLQDYYQVAALQIRNGFQVHSPAEWKALWEGNPAYKSGGSRWPIGWVLQANRRDVVGWVGNVISAHRFKGETLFAASPSSWMVDRSFRGNGLQLLNRLLRQNTVDFFVASNVSEASEPFTSRLGFSRVPVGEWDKCAFWITNCRGTAKVALETKSVPAAGLLGWPVSAVLSAWNYLKDNQLRESLSSVPKVKLCPAFDERFDLFWDQLQQENEDMLLGVRSRETLTWHFQKAMAHGTLWILEASEGRRLTAYAIFDMHDNRSTGLRRVRLIDFQAARGATGAIVSALGWILDACRRARIDVLEITGGWLNRAGIPTIVAPYHRKMPSWRYYYKAVSAQVSGELSDSKVWAPSLYDGDASLY